MAFPRLSPRGPDRALAACVAVSLGIGVFVYWLMGTIGIGERGLPPTVGPFHIDIGALRIAGLAVGVVALTGAISLTIRAAERALPDGTLTVAASLSAAAGGCAWAWRELTEGFIGSNLLAVAAGCGAASLWLLVIAVSCAGRLFPARPRADTRGCEHCARDENLLQGDVQILSLADHNGVVLLRCPRCTWLYVTTLPASASVTAIDEAHAREQFPNTW